MASRKMASGRSKALDSFYAIQVVLFVTLNAATIQSTASSCPEVCTCEPDVYGQDVACIGNDLKTIPEGLPTDTMQLNIRNNDIEVLNLDDLKALSQLEGLDVSSNKIKTIRGTFEDFTKLTQVQLYDNELTTLSQNNFGKAATRMHYVSLFNNPWNCDCNLVWMKTQLDSGNSSLSPQRVKCETPEELRGNYTADIDVDKLVCKQMQGLSRLQMILMSTIIPSVAVLCAILATTIYCYKRRNQPLTVAQPDTEPVGSRYDEPLLPEANAGQIEIPQHPPPVQRQHEVMVNAEPRPDNVGNLAAPVRADDRMACTQNTPETVETMPKFSLLGCVPTSTTIALEWRFQYGRQPDSCELNHGKLWIKGIRRGENGPWRYAVDNIKPDTEHSFKVRGIFDGQHGCVSETIELQTLLTDNLQKECEEGCTAKQYLKDFCILGNKTYKEWMEKLGKTLEGTWGLTGWLLDRDAEPGTFKLDNLEWQKQNCKKVILVFGESSEKNLYEELNLQTALTGFLEDTRLGGEKRLIPVKMSSAVKLPTYMSAFEEFSFDNKYFWKRLVTGLTDKHICVMNDENGEVKTATSV